MREEYIRRADAMEKITSSETQKALRTMTGEEAYVTVVGILNELPAADVRPVVHGKWEFLGPNNLIKECMCGTCSVCKIRSKYIVNTALCPRCGAKMDGDGRWR